MERHALRDDQFARIENLLPGSPGDGSTRVETQRISCVMLFSRAADAPNRPSSAGR